MPITLTEEPTAEGVTLSVNGTVDLSTADQLAGRITDIVARPTPKVVVDLADVLFIDSTGLNALVAAFIAISETESSMILARPTDNVRFLLKITGLDKLFTIAESPSPA